MRDATCRCYGTSRPRLFDRGVLGSGVRTPLSRKPGRSNPFGTYRGRCHNDGRASHMGLQMSPHDLEKQAGGKTVRPRAEPVSHRLRNYSRPTARDRKQNPVWRNSNRRILLPRRTSLQDLVEQHQRLVVTRPQPLIV